MTKSAPSPSAARPRKAPLAYEPTSVSEIEALLRASRAPEPWARPERLADLADFVDSCAALRDGTPLSPALALRARAQAAIDELRRVLPTIVEFAMASAAGPSLLTSAGMTAEEKESWIAEQTAKAQAEERMLAALVDVAPDRRALRLLPLDAGNASHWHFAAAGLFVIYRSAVGSASVSKHGPAVAFVRSALARAGYRCPESSAVEKALARHPLTTNSS